MNPDRCTACEIGRNAWPIVVEKDASDWKRNVFSPPANNIPPRGRLDARVLILGSQPTEHDLEHHGAFSGPLRGYMDDWLKRGQLDPKDICYAYAVRCRPAPNLAAEQRHVRACIERHLYDLLGQMPNLKVILAMGNPANWGLKMVDAWDRGQDYPYAPEKAVPGGIMKERGIEWPMHCGVIVLPTLHPTQVLRQLNLENTLIGDIRKVGYLLGGGHEKKQPVHYWEARTPEEADRLFALLRERGHFVWDSETTTVNWPTTDDHFLCLQFATEVGEGVYLPLWENPLADYPWSRQERDVPETALVRPGDLKNYWVEHYGEGVWRHILDEVRSVMEDTRISKTGHNIMFDARMLWALHGIECRNFRMDTMIAHSLLDQDSPHGLKELANNHTDLGAYDRDLDLAFKEDVKRACDRANRKHEREVKSAYKAALEAEDRRVNAAWYIWSDSRKEALTGIAKAVRKEFGITGKDYPVSGKLTENADDALHRELWEAIEARLAAQCGPEPERTSMAEVETAFRGLWSETEWRPFTPHYGMLPLSMLKLYACQDVDATIRLEEQFRPELERRGQPTPEGGRSSLATIHDGVMMPLLRALVESTVVGVQLDVDLTRQTAAALQAEAREVNERIQRDLKVFGVAEPVDVGSAKQLVTLLYDTLALPVLERSAKTQEPATGKKVLQTVAKRIRGYREAEDKTGYLRKFREKGAEYMPDAEILRLKRVAEHKGADILLRLLHDIEEYRMAVQRDATFCTGFLAAMDEKQRLHPNYRISRDENGKGTATGRLCVAEGTLIEVVRDVSTYPKGVPVECVQPGMLAYTFDTEGRLTLRPIVWTGRTGTKPVLRVHWRGAGNKHTGYLDLTPNHEVRLVDGAYCRAEALKVGDHLAALSRDIGGYGYARLYASGHKEPLRDHRFVYQTLTGDATEHVHHKDGNKLNNVPENLGGLTSQEHGRLHCAEWDAERRQRALYGLEQARLAGRDYPRGAGVWNYLGLDKDWMLNVLEENEGKPTAFRDVYGIDYETAQKYLKLHGIDWKAIRRRFTRANGHSCIDVTKDWLESALRECAGKPTLVHKTYGVAFDTVKKKAAEYGIDIQAIRQQARSGAVHNHMVTHIEVLEGAVDVYDLEVEGTHNFIANEIAVHNSTESPNLLNLPRTTDAKPGEPNFGKAIRQQFIPRMYPSGRGVILDFDLSQAEVRTAGSLAHDETLWALFDQGVDIHSFVASKVPGFQDILRGLTPSEIKARAETDKRVYECRSKAKSALFGTMYGQSPAGLASNPDFGATTAQAEEIIATLFAQMPGVARWMETTKRFAMRNGYVVTPWGRRRVLKDARSPIRGVQSGALRQAVNSPVQSHASDYCLTAYDAIWMNLRGFLVGLDTPFKVGEGDGICKTTGRPFVSRQILVVHDAILVDGPVEEAEEVSAIVQHCMSLELPSHYVKMAADGGAYDRWSGKKVDAVATYRARMVEKTIGPEEYVYAKKKEKPAPKPEPEPEPTVTPKALEVGLGVPDAGLTGPWEALPPEPAFLVDPKRPHLATSLCELCRPMLRENQFVLYKNNLTAKSVWRTHPAVKGCVAVDAYAVHYALDHGARYAVYLWEGEESPRLIPLLRVLDGKRFINDKTQRYFVPVEWFEPLRGVWSVGLKAAQREVCIAEQAIRDTRPFVPLLEGDREEAHDARRVPAQVP